MLFLSGVRVRKGWGGDLNIRHVRFCTGGHGGERAARRPHPTPPHRPTTYRPNGHPTSVTHPTPPPSKQPAGQNVIYMVPLHNDSYPLNTYERVHTTSCTGRQIHTYIMHRHSSFLNHRFSLRTKTKTHPETNQPQPTTTNHNQPQPTTTNQPTNQPPTNQRALTLMPISKNRSN